MQALSDGQQTERLESQVGDLGDRIDGVETNLGRRIESVETKLGARIDHVETKLDDRINGVEDKMEKVRAESRADFRVLLGAILATFLTLLIQHL